MIAEMRSGRSDINPCIASSHAMPEVEPDSGSAARDLRKSGGVRGEGTLTFTETQVSAPPQTPAGAGRLRAKRVRGDLARARARSPWCNAGGSHGHDGRPFRRC